MTDFIRGWVHFQRIHTTSRVSEIVELSNHLVTIVGLKGSMGTSSDAWVRHSRYDGKVVKRVGNS